MILQENPLRLEMNLMLYFMHQSTGYVISQAVCGINVRTHRYIVFVKV